jgi:hypothetical protein
LKKHEDVTTILTQLEEIWDEFQTYENDEIKQLDNPGGNIL